MEISLHSLKFTPVTSSGTEDKLIALVSGKTKSGCSKLRIGDSLYIQPTDPVDISILLDGPTSIALDPLLDSSKIVVEPSPSALSDLAPSPPQSLCDICESSPVAIECLECKHNTRLCVSCYASSHRGPGKKSHRVSTLTPGASLSLPSPQCKVHPDEARKFVCRQCRVTVCGSCLLVGTHKGHDAVPFGDVAEYAKAEFGPGAKKHAGNVEKLKAMKEEALDKRGKLSSSLAESKAAVEARFADIETLVESHEGSTLSRIEEDGAVHAETIAEIDSLLSECELACANTKALLEEACANGITPDRYDFLASAIKQQQEHEHTAALREKVYRAVKSVEVARSHVTLPDFDLSELRAQLDASVKIPPEVAAGVSITGIKRWRMATGLEHSGWWPGVAYEESKRRYFVVANPTDNKVHVYDSFDDLVRVGVPSQKVVSLERGRAGTYFAVVGESIYYSVPKAAEIVRADASTGKLTYVLKVPAAGTDNESTSAFGWGGFTDLAPMLDPATQRLYVMYQDLEVKECKLRRIVLSPTKMSFGDTWVLEGKRKADFGFAFVNSDRLYLGSSYCRAKIDCYFDLKLRRWEDSPEINLPGDFRLVTHVMSAPEQTIIVSDYNRGVFCLEPD